MCIFSPVPPVSWLRRVLGAPRTGLRVSGTRIYGRVEGDRQALVYSMHLAVSSEVAMVLPLPVAAGSGEDAVRFVDLSGHPTLFDDLEALFLVPQTQGLGVARSKSLGAPRPTLAVHGVGAFDASYVPSVADFDRLDPRFRLSPEVWSALPHARDHGFAVFVLRPGDARVHPMALWFPTRDPARVFFPTVHVHDGRVHERAHFDHALFWQGTQRGDEGDGTSFCALGPAASERSRGVLAGSEHVRVRRMRGEHANRDVWIA